MNCGLLSTVYNVLLYNLIWLTQCALYKLYLFVCLEPYFITIDLAIQIQFTRRRGFCNEKDQFSIYSRIEWWA